MRFSKLNMNRLLGFSHLNKAGSWLFIMVLLAGNTWDHHSSLMILGKVTGINSINICNVKLHPIFLSDVMSESRDTAWLCGAQPPSSWFVKVSSRLGGGGPDPAPGLRRSVSMGRKLCLLLTISHLRPPRSTLLPLASFQERSVKKHDILQGSLQL